MNKYTVNGREYNFEEGKHPAGADVLIAYWNENGETFAMYAIETDLPESQEEAEEFIDNLDWQVKEF